MISGGNLMYTNTYIYYCTRCGTYTKNSDDGICPFCKARFKEYDCKTTDVNDLPEVEKLAILYDIIMTIRKSPDFDPDLHNQMIIKNGLSNKNRNRIICPRCNSANIEEISLGDKVVSLQMFDGGSPMIGKKMAL